MSDPHKSTQDQIACVMLLHGTAEQQKTALEYCAKDTPLTGRAFELAVAVINAMRSDVTMVSDSSVLVPLLTEMKFIEGQLAEASEEIAVLGRKVLAGDVGLPHPHL